METKAAPAWTAGAGGERVLTTKMFAPAYPLRRGVETWAESRHFKRDDWIVLVKHLSWPVPLPAVKARTTPPTSRGRGGFYAAEPNDSDPQPARSTPMALASMALDRRRNRARMYDKPAAGVMNWRRSSTAAGARD